MSTIHLNGEPCTVRDDATVEALLRERGLDRAACAVEVNRRVIPRSEHPATVLNNGDVVEIVTLVGGG